ncbi:TPA: DUF551 domain-containing protein [Klebsiella pneumoniae]
MRKGPDMPPAQPEADSEPDRNPVLAYADSYRDMAKQGLESVPIWSVITDLERNIAPLYRHAQPAVVSEKIIDNFEEEFRRAFEVSAAVEQLIEIGYQGDKFSLSIRDAATLWKLGRAAMLQGGNSPVIPDGWTCNDKANAALMMLDRIETADPVDDDRIDGIKRIVRELAAAPHDTPALNSVQSVVTVPGKWIPVSERMPENDVSVLTFDGMYKRVHHAMYGHWQCWEPEKITHWMPLPAAPREVK